MKHRTDTAEVNLGFDVRVPLPGRAAALCLQYKIVTPVVRHRAKSRIQRPSFKFVVKGHQNEKLCDQLVQNFAYYCAPLFFTESDLERHFSTKQLLEHCVFIHPPNSISATDSHDVLFNAVPEAIVCSEPQEIEERYSYKQLISQISEQKRDTSDVLRSLYEQLHDSIEVVRKHERLFEEEFDYLSELVPSDLRYNLENLRMFSLIRAAMRFKYGADFHLI